MYYWVLDHPVYLHVHIAWCITVWDPDYPVYLPVHGVWCITDWVPELPVYLHVHCAGQAAGNSRVAGTVLHGLCGHTGHRETQTGQYVFCAYLVVSFSLCSVYVCLSLCSLSLRLTLCFVYVCESALSVRLLSCGLFVSVCLASL